MLAVQFPQPKEFILTEVPVPKPGPQEVLMRVRSTTICGTDLKIFHGTFPGVTYPHIPGHEWGGEIVEVGPGVADLSVGDAVGVEVHVGCGSCPRCLEGYYNLCAHYGQPESGHAHIGFTIPGGLAEYCVIPARAAHVLPEELSFDHGAFTDTLGIVLWGFERAGGVRAGETVVIIGPGALGLLAVQVASAQGSGLVITVGAANDADRLKIAGDTGADVLVDIGKNPDPVQVVRELTHGWGADLVIEFAGSALAAKQAIEMARRGGRVVLGGSTGPGRILEVDLSVIVRGHLDIYGSVANPQAISRYANELMAKGLVDIQPLITHHRPLHDFPSVWESFQNRKDGMIRPMMHP